MDTWDKFKYAYEQYFCESDKSRIDKKGYSLISSGINNYFFNYMFVDSENIKNINPMININFNMAIFSLEQSRAVLESWSKKSNIKFLGSGAIMTKNIEDDSYEKKQIEDVSVVNVQENSKYIEDYIKVMSKVKKVSEKDIKEKFIKNNNNVYTYLGYFNGRPAGVLSAVIVDNSAISVDSAIIEDARSIGVLTALGEQALTDGIEKGIKSYSSIVTSPYTMKLVERQGYKFETICDVWVYSNE